VEAEPRANTPVTCRRVGKARKVLGPELEVCGLGLEPGQLRLIDWLLDVAGIGAGIDGIGETPEVGVLLTIIRTRSLARCWVRAPPVHQSSICFATASRGIKRPLVLAVQLAHEGDLHELMEVGHRPLWRPSDHEAWPDVGLEPRRCTNPRYLPDCARGVKRPLVLAVQLAHEGDLHELMEVGHRRLWRPSDHEAWPDVESKLRRCTNPRCAWRPRPTVLVRSKASYWACIRASSCGHVTLRNVKDDNFAPFIFLHDLILCQCA